MNIKSVWVLPKTSGTLKQPALQKIPRLTSGFLMTHCDNALRYDFLWRNALSVSRYFFIFFKKNLPHGTFTI